jgi:hypothetical protein
LDQNGKDLKTSTYAKAWLTKGNFFKEVDKIDVENYARYILWFLSGGLFFWGTIALFTNKTVMPVLLIFLAIQQFFFLGC